MRLCGIAQYICFSQDVNIKVALSSLQFNIIELVLYGYWLGEEGVTSNYHILMNNRANFNE